MPLPPPGTAPNRRRRKPSASSWAGNTALKSDELSRSSPLASTLTAKFDDCLTFYPFLCQTASFVASLSEESHPWFPAVGTPTSPAAFCKPYIGVPQVTDPSLSLCRALAIGAVLALLLS